MKNGIQIRGIKEIYAALSSMERNLQKKTFRKVLRYSCKIFQNEVKSIVPKRTGASAKSIKVRAAKSKKGRISYKTTIGIQNYVGDTFYFAFLEFGHKLGKRGSLKPRKQVKALDFMGRGFRRKAPQLSRQLPAMIWDEIARQNSNIRRTRKAA